MTPGNSLFAALKKSKGMLQHWRLLVYFLLGIMLLIFEYNEHNRDVLFGSPPVIELSLYFVFLTLIGILTESAISLESKRKQALELLEVKHQLILYLSNANSVEELFDLVIKFLRQIAQVIGIVFLDCPGGEKLAGKMIWLDESEIITLPDIDSNFICQVFSTQKRSTGIQQIRTIEAVSYRSGKLKAFFLPLQYGEDMVGGILLLLPGKENLDSEQRLVLQNLDLEIAEALITTKNRQSLRDAEILNLTSAERLEIARDLHDTVGQNLGFLHFKLDQILMDFSKKQDGDLYDALSLLRKLANESYEMVRETLVIMNRDSQHSLEHILHVQAEQIAERAGFEIEIKENGKPQPLSPNVIRQISFVIKEIMRNVEQHAKASQVLVNLAWEPNGLTVAVRDDGCGFDQGREAPVDHFGLKIMRERIESIGGMFELATIEGQGTDIKFSIPIHLASKAGQPA